MKQYAQREYALKGIIILLLAVIIVLLTAVWLGALSPPSPERFLSFFSREGYEKYPLPGPESQKYADISAEKEKVSGEKKEGYPAATPTTSSLPPAESSGESSFPEKTGTPSSTSSPSSSGGSPAQSIGGEPVFQQGTNASSAEGSSIPEEGTMEAGTPSPGTSPGSSPPAEEGTGGAGTGPGTNETMSSGSNATATSGNGTASPSGSGGSPSENVPGNYSWPDLFAFGERNCYDGRDNDGDGLIDRNDPHCEGQRCSMIYPAKVWVHSSTTQSGYTSTEISCCFSTQCAGVRNTCYDYDSSYGTNFVKNCGNGNDWDICSASLLNQESDGGAYICMRSGDKLRGYTYAWTAPFSG